LTVPNVFVILNHLVRSEEVVQRSAATAQLPGRSRDTPEDAGGPGRVGDLGSIEQPGGGAVTEEQVLIKKYSNRKLYDLNRSRYVTLEEIAEMIRQGRQVKIVDADSQEDLTNVTLVQILLEEEKRRNLLPVAFLHRLIKYGEMYQDVFRQYLSSSLDAMLSMQREAKKGMEQWTKLGGLDEMAPSGEPAIRENPANVKAELDSLKEKLTELEKKLGL